MANQTTSDGTFDFSGGSNAAFDAGKIPENCFELGINISSRKAVISPRWGWEQLTLNFTVAGQYTRKNKSTISYQNLFKEGRFQALFPYSIGTNYYIGVVVSGLVYLIEQKTLEVTVLNASDPLYIQHQRVNWSNAGKFFALFDFPNYPLILDGLSVRRANPGNSEIPVSELGAYNQNRLFISNAGIDFTAGDPTGSLSAPDAPITFKEIQQASSPFVGESYQLPTSNLSDRITAMGFLQVIDTSTGIGPLLVATDRSIYSFASQNPRANWLTSNFGTVVLANSGIAGQRAQVNVNSDLIFRSADAQIRALSMSRNESRRWSNAPISNEIETINIFRDKDLIKYGTLSYHKDKVFVAINPYRVKAKDLDGKDIVDIAHGGFAVLELSNSASLTAQANPTWAGLWTGVRPMDMIENNGEAFVISKDEAGINVLYKVRPDKTYDIRDGKQVNFRSRIYTREYDWKSVLVKKELVSLKLQLNDIEDSLKVSTYYRPGHGSRYAKWKDYEFEAPVRQCKPGLDARGFLPQSVRDVLLGSVDNDHCEGTARELYNIVRSAQIRVDITGRNWKIKGIEVVATSHPDQDQLLVDCDKAVPVPVTADCNDDWDIAIDKSGECDAKNNY